MWAKIITIKRTKDLNYFSLFAFNLFNTRVSQFELNYWNKWTFPRHSNLLRCTCIFLYHTFLHVKKYLTLCQSCLHTASETFIRHKNIRIRFDFLHFRIRSIHFDRKTWRIQKKRKNALKNFGLSVLLTFSLEDHTWKTSELSAVWIKLKRVTKNVPWYSLKYLEILILI